MARPRSRVAIPRGWGQTTASYPGCALTGTLPHGPRDYYDMQYAIRYGSRECDMRCEYVMGRANAIRGMRYAICENAMGRAKAICDTQIGCALWAIAKLLSRPPCVSSPEPVWSLLEMWFWESLKCECKIKINLSECFVDALNARDLLHSPLPH